MSNIFKRIVQIGESELHTLIDGFEDPVKMTEQGIRDLNTDIERSVNTLAEIRAMKIRSQEIEKEYRKNADEYERKAMLIVQKAQNGQLERSNADRLAAEALKLKDNYIQKAQQEKQNQIFYDEQLKTLEDNIAVLKNNMGVFEKELIELKVKRTTEKKQIEQERVYQIPTFDDENSSETLSMLERMKHKVETQEHLSDAYSKMNDTEKFMIDEEIDSAISEKEQKAKDALSALKEKMGIKKDD